MEQGSYIPPNWRPTPQTIAGIRERHPWVNIDQEVENFVDYWQAESGQRARKRDWQAAFRTWCRRVSKPRNWQPESNVVLDFVRRRNQQTR